MDENGQIIGLEVLDASDRPDTSIHYENLLLAEEPEDAELASKA